MSQVPDERPIAAVELCARWLRELAASVVVCCLVALYPHVAANGADPPSRPNVVLILADDLGWGDLACYGHPYAKTPHIDRLAGEGTRFKQFYVTGITCCPSRTGFMTGKFPATFRGYPAGHGFGERITITLLLKQRGYHTGHFGKWHIGASETPGTYGIDVTPVNSDRGGRKQDSRGRDATLFDDAIRFIEQHRDGPFYVNVWAHSTHYPVDPPQPYVDRFLQITVKVSDFPDPMREKFAAVKAAGGDVHDSMRRYLGDVSALDDCVGRLLARIDELGLRDSTLIVFSSDHGASAIQIETGDDGTVSVKRNKKKPNQDNAAADRLRLNMMGDNGDLRGGKHNMYEGGVRVPFIVRWPGRVPARRVDETSVISGIDWLPTLCALAGVRIDASDFDGEDVSAAWLGGQHTRAKALLWKTSNPRAAIAIRDGKWKLIDPNRNRGDVELFDLSTDPGEQTNVAAAQPQVVRALLAKTQAWNARLPTEYDKTGAKDD
jgi:N-acetylgalactosamine-6-sulfatase